MNRARPVTAHVQRLTIPTYPVHPPDRNPMFFENRNIQGSSGTIYPRPFSDRLGTERVDKEYEAVVLENEYIGLVLLPELGGRIFSGRDKTNGYDFFYRHDVIKPALIGLFGPWISGGVEFNWPQHHRPGTLDPCSCTIAEQPDGSAIVWMGEHDPLNRTKGMVGISLAPGKAYVETKVRLYNRTPVPQTFLWWANAAVHINESYQVVFPPDVRHAVFHGKNPVTSYPIARGPYNSGMDYGDGTDVSLWANSRAPTSFFAGESRYGFFGGYDHRAQAGTVHVADPAISPGKKFFTWGNGPSGHRWQRNLMDDRGEYLELMAGVYTDNQPDFSWIMPYETKCFSQFWYPVQKIGPMKNANLSVAVNLELKADLVFVGVYGVQPLPGCHVTVSASGADLLDRKVDLAPGQPFTTTLTALPGLAPCGYLLRVCSAAGHELIRYRPEEPGDCALPESYRAPARPEEIGSIEELYLAGLHLEQYRHPTIPPERYWEEALRRDPCDSRVTAALGKRMLRRTRLGEAEALLRTAVARQTSRNANPYDGDALYHLGLVLELGGRADEAYRFLAKAGWCFAWRSAAAFAMAQIDCLRGELDRGLEHLDLALRADADNLKARDLRAAVLRRMKRFAEAGTALAETISLDPLDFWARCEALLVARAAPGGAAAPALDDVRRLLRADAQNYLDVAFDYAAAGFHADARDVLLLAVDEPPAHPMIAYTLGWLFEVSGEDHAAATWYEKAGRADPSWCFPWRGEEGTVLRSALARNPADARAACYLGNLLWDKGRRDEAVDLWRAATTHEPGLSTPWRNLGLAACTARDLPHALQAYERAIAADPEDPRILLEYEQLLRRRPAAPEELLALLERMDHVVAKRDDLSLRRMALLSRCGRAEEALRIARGRSFHPWEGGEGAVAAQYTCAHWILGREALEKGDAATALLHFEAGLDLPDNLGEDPGEGASVPLLYYRGLAFEALGKDDQARGDLERVARFEGPVGIERVYKGMSLIRLGRGTDGRQLLSATARECRTLAAHPPEEDFFNAGSPSPVVAEDPCERASLRFMEVAGLAELALGNTAAASTLLGNVATADPSNVVVHEELRRLEARATRPPAS